MDTKAPILATPKSIKEAIENGIAETGQLVEVKEETIDNIQAAILDYLNQRLSVALLTASGEAAQKIEALIADIHNRR